MAGIVRPERQDDIDAIRQVHRAAFGRAAEARLVDALRASGKLLISLVMDCEGKIAGHIGFSPIKINEETDRRWPCAAEHAAALSEARNGKSFGPRRFSGVPARARSSSRRAGRAGLLRAIWICAGDANEAYQ